MGEWTDKMKGRVKETVGAATGDQTLEAEGKRDTLKGNLKEKAEDLKRAIKGTASRAQGRRRR